MTEASIANLFRRGRGRHLAEVIDARVGAGFSRSCTMLYGLALMSFKVYWCIHAQTLIAALPESAARHGECGEVLVGFMSWYSSILLLQLVMVEPFIRVGMAVVLWIASSGLLETSRGAKPGTLDALQVVEFDAELFADAENSSDPRPQKECCICLDEYDAESVIVRTPCRHLMHRACLAKWLKTSHFCPICRGNLEEEEEEEEENPV